MTKRPALLCLAVLMLAGLAQSAPAQSLKSMAVSRPPTPAPSRGGGIDHGGRGGVATGIISTLPSSGTYSGYRPADGGYGPPPSRRRAQRQARRRSNAPPAGERRLVPDEVVIELRHSAASAQIAALQRRFRLVRVARTPLALTGTTFFRWRIPDRRSVATVVRQLETEGLVASAQPNYRFTLQETAAAKREGDPAPYELAKLHLPETHALAKSDAIRIAMIDSAADTSHANIESAVAEPSMPSVRRSSRTRTAPRPGRSSGSAPTASDPSLLLDGAQIVRAASRLATVQAAARALNLRSSCGISLTGRGGLNRKPCT